MNRANLAALLATSVFTCFLQTTGTSTNTALGHPTEESVLFAAGSAAMAGADDRLPAEGRAEYHVADNRVSLVEVPSVLGLSPANAQSKLIQFGLAIRFESHSQVPKTRAQEFSVARQSPRAGERVPIGTAVTASIFPAFESSDLNSRPTSRPPQDNDRTPWERPTVPNVVGMTLLEAMDRLETAGLSVGRYEDTGAAMNPENSLRVHTQIPASGEPIPVRQKVALKFYGEYKPFQDDDEQHERSPETQPRASREITPDSWVGVWVASVDAKDDSRIRITRQGNYYIVQLLDSSKAADDDDFFLAIVKILSMTLNGTYVREDSTIVRDVKMRIGSNPTSGSIHTISEFEYVPQDDQLIWRTKSSGRPGGGKSHRFRRLSD